MPEGDALKGRWRLFRRETPIFGRPWLVLRGDEYVGAMFNGAVLELDRGVARRLGPDILADPPDCDAMLRSRNPLLSTGRRRSHGLLVPRVPEGEKPKTA
jgi:hypothetical protein